MPTTLTTLPPEIRNMIWELCVLSPTRELEPVSRSMHTTSNIPKPLRPVGRFPKPLVILLVTFTNRSPSGPQNYLVISDSKSSVAHDHQHKPTDTQVTGFISTSLLRTCRQIYLKPTRCSGVKTHSSSETPSNICCRSNLWGKSLPDASLVFDCLWVAHHCRTLAVLEKTLRKILSYAPK